MYKSWYGRPVLVIFVFFAITVVFLFISRDIRLGESHENKYTTYSIRFEYFGMDAEEMERLITIPLEEKLSGLSDLFEMRSVSEYGKTVVTAYFNRSANSRHIYVSLRDIVDTLYVTLPQAVQKPRIYSSASEQKAVLSIAVTASVDLNVLRKLADTVLKKELEGIDGVAEVIVSGGTIDEIRVEFDPERVVDGGINPSSFSTVIQDANVITPGGILQTGVVDIPVMLDTKIKTLDEIKKIPVKLGEKMTSLEYLADIAIVPREKNEIVRINGKECIAIQIKASFMGNSIRISEECKKVLAASGLPKDSYQILYNNGDFLQKLIRTVFIAIIESFVCIVIIIPLFFRSIHTIGLLLFLLPVNAVWTIAQLNMLGYSLDQNTLAGISIALGLIVDGALVIAGLAERNTSPVLFFCAVRSIMAPVCASAATTMLALVPLYFLDHLVPGIRNVVVTIGLMILNSLFLSIVFFPCFVPYAQKTKTVIPARLFSIIRHFYTRMAFFISRNSIRHSRFYCAVYFSVLIAAFVFFSALGKNILLDTQDNIIYAVIEFEPEKSPAAIDTDITAVCALIQQEKGVRFIQTESRLGSAELEIGFDEKMITRSELANRIASYETKLSDGFLYVPESGAKKNNRTHEIEVTVVGDESGKCREIARQAVERVGRSANSTQVVLNFKEPEKCLLFIPDRDTLIKNGISAQTVAFTLRWMVFGPVVDKWIQNETETDIRVAGKKLRQITAERIANLPIPVQSGEVRLNALGRLVNSLGSGKIYRRDGRRAAYFTAHINAKSTDSAVMIIQSILESEKIEKGYGYLLSRELASMKEQYRFLLFIFVASILGIIILLTALTENIVKSVLIASIIPVSITLPLFVKLVTGEALEMGDVLGMVIVSGLSVNNAIYIAESAKSTIPGRVREKMQSILVTSLTSIAGSVPLAILGTGFSANLAFFMIWGITGSVIAGILLFPAVLQQSGIR